MIQVLYGSRFKRASSYHNLYKNHTGTTSQVPHYNLLIISETTAGDTNPQAICLSIPPLATRCGSAAINGQKATKDVLNATK
ncbi:hypothetical protein EYC84_000373 [Monilinia fructicola]|uniref:Uncharacterized protein n=1 Tax=Monilinia fructicola TaxID=38448 RepID=A0A5M9JND1_MONFR|nr:hypothetical protein EYC84_000373 [Monilinia fructicola]